MVVSDYSLRLAKKHVEEFARQDEAMAEHRAIMKKCRECEAFLASGIEAYRWLKQADETLRQAAVEGFDVPVEASENLAFLHRAWLRPCESAERWIQEQEKSGWPPENQKQFLEAREYVQRQVCLLEMEENLEEGFRGNAFDEAFWSEAHKMRSS